MDIKRITTQRDQGAAKSGAQTSQRVSAVQSRAIGGIQLPRFSVYRKATQTVANNSWTTVDFDFIEFDTDGIYNDTTDQADFTDLTAGVWQINLTTQWESNTTASRAMRLYLNATTQIQQSYSQMVATAGTSAGFANMRSSFLLTLQENDSVDLQVIQFSGGNLDLTFASFQAFRIGV